MRNDYAKVSHRVSRQIPPRTQGYASNYFSLRGSYIRGEAGSSRRDSAPRTTYAYRHTQPRNTRNRVTSRPSRKTKRSGCVPGYALKRYTTDWRPSQCA